MLGYLDSTVLPWYVQQMEVQAELQLWLGAAALELKQKSGREDDEGRENLEANDLVEEESGFGGGTDHSRQF